MNNFEQAKIRFLRAIAKCGDNGAQRKDLPVADRANDKVRQSCRREWLCVYDDRGNGFRWHLLDRGAALLKGADEIEKDLDRD